MARKPSISRATRPANGRRKKNVKSTETAPAAPSPLSLYAPLERIGLELSEISRDLKALLSYFQPGKTEARLQGPDARCACGKSFVGASGGHGRKSCGEPAKPAPEEKRGEVEALPTFEALREAAVRFAQKHSKAAMLKVLSKYTKTAPEDAKLSLVPETKRQAVIDEFTDF